MTFLVSIHLQDPVPDWPAAIVPLPAGTVLKFFQTENCSEAKQHNPHIKTVKRYYNENQGQYWRDIDPCVGARRWLEAFVDGTFFQHSANIDFIEGLNEEMALTKPPEEVEQLVKWNEALCDIWYNDYQVRIAEYRHIDLVLCNTPIGNDIPIAIAYLAHEYGYRPVIGYHPYVPVLDKAILEGEAMYYSQRWQEMDKEWARQGLRVRWMFTEIGPVGYHEDGLGNIHLHPNDGWQHAHVCAGDLDNYIYVLEYWAQETANSVAYQEGRVFSGHLFTSTVASQGWDSFKTNQPELGQVLTHFAQWQPETPTPQNPPQMVDVSYHRVDVPFGDLKPRIEAVYARLSRDLTVDWSFAGHYDQAREDGKYVGAFHFLDSRYDMVAQAEFFINQLANWQCDLPAMVDIEEVTRKDGSILIPLPTQLQLDQFFGRLWQSVERACIYTSAQYYDQVTINNYGCDLMVADWRNVESPKLPKAWEGEGWIWWQYTSSKIYEGYPQTLDSSHFNGTFAELDKYVQGESGGINRQRLYEAGKAAQRLYLNSEWALFKAIDNNPLPNGMYPTSNEFDYQEDGIAYKGQTAFNKADTRFYIYYVPVGDWNNVRIEIYNG